MIKELLNYSLAFYMWLVLGRAALSFFTTDMNNFFYATLYRATEPAYRLARAVLPCCHTLAIVLSLLLLRFLVIKYL